MCEMLDKKLQKPLVNVDPFCTDINSKTRVLDPTIQLLQSQVESSIQQVDSFKQKSRNL